MLKSVRILMALGFACLLAVPGLSSAALASEENKDPKTLLVVTHTAGFRHSSIPIAEEVIEKIGKETGIYNVKFCRTADDVKEMMTPEALKNYDGVFFANTTGNLGIPDLHAFLDWIKQGNAFIGAHSATDTYHPEQIGGDRSYIDMIGGQFKTHGAQCEVNCIVEDPEHPSVKHVAPVYTIFDEIYIFRENTRDKVHVLLALDKYPPDGSQQANEPGDHLIAWCRLYGDGRVFYTALGHREDVWESEPFQKHILGGMQWALGLKEGKPFPEKPTEDED